MKESFHAELRVNTKDIELQPFVEQYVAGAVTGAVRTLKGVDELRTLEMKMARKAVTLAVNGKTLETTQFLNEILGSTVVGIVGPLKGVDKEIDDLQLDVKVVR